MPTATPPCPRCGSAETVPVAYGLPDEPLFEAAQRGEVAIGGCIVGRPGGDPDRACRACGHEWVSGVRDPAWSLEE